MKIVDRLALWIAFHLPRKVVYYAFCRVVGLYVDMSKLTVWEAIERWEARERGPSKQ